MGFADESDTRALGKRKSRYPCRQSEKSFVLIEMLRQACGAYVPGKMLFEMEFAVELFTVPSERTFPDHQIEHKADIGNNGCNQNPGESRSRRVPGQHHTESHAKDDTELHNDGNQTPERESMNRFRF